MTTRLTFSMDLPGGQIKRLSEAILYVCGVCETDEAFGATRLNKILFEADFFSFSTRGRSITGVRYQRLQHGPAPKSMPHRFREMSNEGALHVRQTDYLGKPQNKPIALRRPDLSVFDAEDVAILDSVIRESWGRTAGEVSDASHRIEWLTRENGDDIPYEAVWLSNEPVTTADYERTTELAVMYGW